MLLSDNEKRKRFDEIIDDIKNIKIQGARNIARSAIYAYSLIPANKSKEKLISSRPTEPMLQNVLSLVDTVPYSLINEHFDVAQEKINKNVFSLLKNGDLVFTHCHSTNVVNALIYAKKMGKKFEVYNTETRPLFQGRKTSKELSKQGIHVTEFVDSAMNIVLSGSQGFTKPTAIFLGADALLKTGVINKIGSELIAIIAKSYKIPVYVIADSWKFTSKSIPLEQRKLEEVCDRAPKEIKIKNPAFEFINKKYISGIITELGFFPYSKFLFLIMKKDHLTL